MLAQRVIRQEVSASVKIAKADLLKYYIANSSSFIRQDQVFLREVLVQNGPNAKERAASLLARISGGEEFEALAKAHSDSESRENGGLLPAFKQGDLAKDVEDAVWDKPRGYVTPVLQRPNGFLILKVEAHESVGVAPFEEVEAEIFDKLLQPRMPGLVRRYLTKLRQEAVIEIAPGYADTGSLTPLTQGGGRVVR